MQTLLKGAHVFIGNKFKETDILIEDGRIVSITDGHASSCLSEEGITGKNSGSDGVCVYNLTDKYIFPGFVDVHVHFREPGFSYKETIETGSCAAAAGGYTDVCAMPNLNPVPDSTETLKPELDAIKKSAIINVYPYGSITKEEKGKELADLEGMSEKVIAFSDDGHGVASEGLMIEAMKRAKALNKLIAAHCEDMSCIGGSRFNQGRLSGIFGIKGISSESEWKMIERDIRLARETGCRYHVCHVSTKESVALIRQAKAEGVDITCETAPHYLLLDENVIGDSIMHDGISPALLGKYKMNPPLRKKDDREAVIEGLLDGTIDMIATDHAPHSDEEKALGLMSSPMGVVGLECAFPVLYTEMVRKEILSLEELLRLMTYAPAGRFGIECGIEVGREAKLCVFDLNGNYVINPASFKSKGRYTPFEGYEVHGKCIMTVCKDVVYRAE
ncbi:MAG: dihydroorotase [Lachnospiraceae bacterium]|nr:dihydroorotase [Lachnospiraceae bacterium]